MPDEEVAEAPLLELRDGIPSVTDSPESLAEAVAALAAADGPIAIDAERASGYRYGNRAYLIQLRRGGGPTFLVDPVTAGPLTSLADVIATDEWILHAATQDLACLAEVGLRPRALFDTELAARLLGLPRVGLAGLVEDQLGVRMRKEHSSVDWSQRPMPESWLDYAALDVEVLIELRDLLQTALDEAGKAEWAAQEFTALLSFEPAVRVDPWRRTSGSHKLRNRRSVAAVRELWLVRDSLAQATDTAPSRILPDAAIVAAAEALPADRAALLAVRGFHGRGAKRYVKEWADAIRRAQTLEESQLPGRPPRVEGPPHPRSWADKDPVAAERLLRARDQVAARAEELQMPTENLISPDCVRRVVWEPPADGDFARALKDTGARQWQVDQVAPIVQAAVESVPREPS